MEIKTDKILINTSQPYTTDPDSTSSCVFLDNDGTFYRVHGMGEDEEEHPGPDWEVRTAIRVQVRDRTNSTILISAPKIATTAPSDEGEHGK